MLTIELETVKPLLGFESKKNQHGVNMGQRVNKNIMHAVAVIFNITQTN